MASTHWHTASDYDVVVVGGGPAGTTAARELADNGASVLLLEKARMPRYKACGGGLTRRARLLLTLDVDPVIERECHSAELHLLDCDLHFTVTRREPLTSLVMRDRFDAHLFQAASRAGADVADDEPMVGMFVDGHGVEVRTGRRAIRCRVVIGADGALSTVARKGGWTGTQTLIPLVEAEVAVPEATLDRFSTSVRFDFGTVPAGYAWVFPKDDHLSVGVGSVKSGRVNLRERLLRHLELLGIDPTGGIEQHGHYVPSGVRKPGPVIGPVLLAGDAAGLVDPVTGEGLSYAVTSGRAAARSIVAGEFDRGRIKDHYLAALRPLMDEMRWGRVLSALLYDSVSIRNRLFRKFGGRLAEAMTDVFCGTKGYSDFFQSYLNYPKLLKRLLS